MAVNCLDVVPLPKDCQSRGGVNWSAGDSRRLVEHIDTLITLNARADVLRGSVERLEARVLVDATGLTGFFVWEFPREIPLLTAMREDLGLKLESGVAMVPVVVIDQVRMPSSN